MRILSDGETRSLVEKAKTFRQSVWVILGKSIEFENALPSSCVGVLLSLMLPLYTYNRPAHLLSRFLSVALGMLVHGERHVSGPLGSGTSGACHKHSTANPHINHPGPCSSCCSLSPFILPVQCLSACCWHFNILSWSWSLSMSCS